MFAGCESLTSLDVSMFNTVKVINMNSMFSGCRRLTTIDLTYFNTNAVKDMAYMFKDCPGVATIFIGNNWKTTSVTSSTQMFYNCTSLVGENGTAYNASNVDKTYARRDLSGSPGYLTLGNTLMKGTSGASNTAYLNTPIIKNTIEKITFMNTTTPNINLTVLGIYDVSINQNNSVQLWYTDSDSDDLYEVYIGQEGGVVASSGEYLFSGLGQLTSIEGLLNFDTSNVYNMAYMFQYCARLTSLSLSTFNTSNVKTMAYMFRGCTNLNNINLYGFNTSNVTNFQYMFDGDTSLTELNLTSFTMGTIRINTNYMFNNCTRLTTIYAGSSWDTIMVNTSTNMFYNCLALVGENGTVYNSSNVDITYAVIDSASTPGYFSQYITVTMDALYCGSDTQVMVTNVDKPNLIQSSYAYAYGGTVGSSPCSSASYNITNNAHQYNFSNSKPNVVCLRLTDILGNYYYFPTTPRSNGADCWW